MKKAKFLLLITGLTLGLAACGGGGSQGNGTSNNAAGSSSSSSANKGAKGIFEKHCASCHGENLQGKIGPNLQHIGSKWSKKQILHQITNGGGGMPAGVIKGQKAQKVAAWLAAKK